MPEPRQEYDVTRPIGVNFKKGETEGWIHCDTEQGQISLHVTAAILVQLLSDLKKGFEDK